MIQEFEKIRVLIAHNGVVHWEPGGVFTTTCDIEILYFPFDMQACEIILGTFTPHTDRQTHRERFYVGVKLC